MDTTAIVLIGFLAFCIFMIVYKFTNKNEEKVETTVSQKKIEEAKAQFSPKQLKFLQTTGFLFNHNMIMPLTLIYEKCGMPHEIACSHNPGLIEQNIPFEKGSDGYNVFKTYAWAVNKRYMLKNSPLMEHPNDVLELNLHNKEQIYHVIYGVVLHQEKTSVTNIAYSGIKWTSGPLRTGTMTVIANESTHFTPMDIGNLVFTNERLIFVGRQKNVTKQIKLTNILYNNLYQDGVMVHIPNHKPLLFKFPDNKDFEIFEISDGINEFSIVLDRLISGNYLDSKALDSAEGSSVNPDSIKKVLAEKNYEPLIADVLHLLKSGEEARISMLQRMLCIGYARAVKIMDEMENLKLVSPTDNGKRVWLIDGFDTDKIKHLMEEAYPFPERN